MSNSKPAVPPAVSNPPSVFVGIDWGDQKHDVCWFTANGLEGHEVIEQSPEEIDALVAFLAKLANGGTVAVALEKSRGPLHYGLMFRENLLLYPLDPKQVASYRESFTSGGAKHDAGDAWFTCRMLRERLAELKPLSLDDEPTRRLAHLSQTRRSLVDDRTRLKLMLTSLLKTYFPLVVEWEWTALWLWSCLRDGPTLGLSPGSSQNALDPVSKAKDQNDERIAELVERVRSMSLVTTDTPLIESLAIRVTALVGQLKMLVPQIEKLESLLDQAFASHPDAHLLERVAGAGRALAPRLLAALGSDRERYANADEIAVISGIAPVTRQSGKSKIVSRRRACSKFPKQTFHEFADAARKWCRWSKAYYRMLRATRNMAHNAAVRKLARCWIRILYAVWKARTPYNPERYMQALEAQHHPLLAFLEPEPEATT